ncbi:MAG: hemolysin family protein [Gemmataceae bacterium]
MWAIELTVMAMMIAFNAVFAAYEIALASLSPARLRVLALEKRAGSSAAVYMKENMEASLAVVQLGITLVGAIAAATGGAGAGEIIMPWLIGEFGLSPTWAQIAAIALVVAPLTALTIMFGELAPKVLAIRHQEWVCLKLSPAMQGFGFAVWPIVWLFETGVGLLTDWSLPGSLAESSELQELSALARLARASRLIGVREENIIHGAARLSSRTIREIMLPAEHIGMLTLNETVGNSLVAAHLDMHTRFPVTEKKGDPQSIIGYVNFKDLVACLRLNPDNPSLQAIVRPIPRLEDSLVISACLERLIRERTHIALVVDDDQVIGMITMEDILEELVGDIQDEYDRLPAQLVPVGHAWLAGGGVSLEQLKTRAGIDLLKDMPAGAARNLNEWVVGHLAAPVQGGEIVERDGVRILIRKVRRQKVLEAQLSEKKT